MRALATSLAVSLMAVVAACGVPSREVEPIDRQDLPDSLRAPASTTTSSLDGAEIAAAAVYWIKGDELVRESVLFEAGPDVDRLLALLERGPARGGDAQSVRSAISDSDAIVCTSERDGEVVVELDEVTGTDQVLAIGQIVMTLTSLPDVTSVRFVRDGETVAVPLPDGSLVRRALDPDDYSPLLVSS